MEKIGQTLLKKMERMKFEKGIDHRKRRRVERQREKPRRRARTDAFSFSLVAPCPCFSLKFEWPMRELSLSNKQWLLGWEGDSNIYSESTRYSTFSLGQAHARTRLNLKVLT